jgi:arylformamidase
MSRLAILVALAAVVGLVTPACTLPPSLCKGTGTVTHRDLRYAQSPGVAARLQSLDLYLPVRKAGCGPAPLVAYVHGGSFINGSKSNKVADKIKLFNAEGWAFTSIEYRLVGDSGAGPTKGVYPAQPQDIGSALGFLADHAAQYGLDPHRMMLLGHSAGAFLVALEATDGTFLEAAGLKLSDVVCTAPLDTETFSVADQIAGGGTQESVYRTVFGNDPAVWDRASPIENVAPGKGIGDFQLFTQGSAARLAGNRRFQTALQEAGSSAGVVRADPLTHPEVNEAVGKPGDQIVTPPLMAFFRECANPAGATQG